MPAKRKVSAKPRKRAGTGRKRRSPRAVLHFHEGVVCRGGSHDPSCDGLGTELFCRRVTFKGVSFNVCLHAAV